MTQAEGGRQRLPSLGYWSSGQLQWQLCLPVRPGSEEPRRKIPSACMSTIALLIITTTGAHGSIDEGGEQA